MDSNVFYSALNKEYKCIERAEGVYVYDTDGNRYIDCASGVAVSNIGHGIPEIIDAMCEQTRKATYAYNLTFTSQAREELSRQVIELAPKGMKRVFFCSGGSEAVESMLKIARQYQIEAGRPSKYKVITRWQSYHGNTIATLSLGGRPSWRWRQEPYLMHMPHIAQCNCYRCPYGWSYPSCKLACAHELERIVKYEGPDSVAAFMLEPIVGTTSAATVPPEGYMETIREICDKYDMLLCADEVITGLGRTGKNFAMDHFGVTPDLISVAKGLGGGYVPIGAVIAHEKVCDAFENGSKSLVHSFTFSGMPVICAAANAVLKYLKDHDLVKRGEVMGELLLHKLKAALEGHPIVGDVRGIGMLLGVEIVKDKNTAKPFAPELGVASKIAEYCFNHGVMILAGIMGAADGEAGEVLQVSPPLTIEEADMDMAVTVLRDAIDTVYKTLE